MVNSPVKSIIYVVLFSINQAMIEHGDTILYMSKYFQMVLRPTILIRKESKKKKKKKIQKNPIKREFIKFI